MRVLLLLLLFCVPASATGLYVVGDSIPAAGWPSLMTDRLSGYTLHNCAVSGATISDVAAQYTNCVVGSASSGDVLMIAGGFINSIHNNESATSIMTTAEGIADAAHADGLKVAWCTVLPNAGDMLVLQQVRDDVNIHIIFSDRWDMLLTIHRAVIAGDPRVFESDKIHLNEYGKFVVARYAAIEWQRGGSTPSQDAFAQNPRASLTVGALNVNGPTVMITDNVALQIQPATSSGSVFMQWLIPNTAVGYLGIQGSGSSVFTGACTYCLFFTNGTGGASTLFGTSGTKRMTIAGDGAITYP